MTYDKDEGRRGDSGVINANRTRTTQALAGLTYCKSQLHWELKNFQKHFYDVRFLRVGDFKNFVVTSGTSLLDIKPIGY